MPAVVRIGDPLSTGHACDTSTNLAGSNQDGTVHANDIDIAVVGAPTQVHRVPPTKTCPPHVAYLNSGSGSVFINGISVGRVGDSADAGAMTGGSGNVFAGG
jgi:uncharacterized Zn-binding protein involved in type VI secretion